MAHPEHPGSPVAASFIGRPILLIIPIKSNWGIILQRVLVFLSRPVALKRKNNTTTQAPAVVKWKKISTIMSVFNASVDSKVHVLDGVAAIFRALTVSFWHLHGKWLQLSLKKNPFQLVCVVTDQLWHLRKSSCLYFPSVSNNQANKRHYFSPSTGMNNSLPRTFCKCKLFLL